MELEIMESDGRLGRYVTRLSGYRALTPHSLPPKPDIIIDEEMWNLLSIEGGSNGGLIEKAQSPQTLILGALIWVNGPMGAIAYPSTARRHTRFYFGKLSDS